MPFLEIYNNNFQWKNYPNHDDVTFWWVFMIKIINFIYIVPSKTDVIKCFDNQAKAEKLRKTILQNKHLTVMPKTRRPSLRWVKTKWQNRKWKNTKRLHESLQVKGQAKITEKEIERGSNSKIEWRIKSIQDDKKKTSHGTNYEQVKED